MKKRPSPDRHSGEGEIKEVNNLTTPKPILPLCPPKYLTFRKLGYI
jgi:hypothetical protein